MADKSKIIKYAKRYSFASGSHSFLFVIFLTLCISANVFAQSDKDRFIPGDTLRWEYFTGKPDSTSGYWSFTLWNVYYNYKIISFHYNTVKIELHVSHFLNTKSWVLPDKESDRLLEHEQGHFNMAILFEEKFKKAIDTTILFFSNYSRQIDSVFTKALNNINEMGIAYDTETNHMWSRQAQEMWNKKIIDMIREAKE